MKQNSSLYLEKKSEFSKNLYSKVFPQIQCYEKLRVNYLVWFFVIMILLTLIECYFGYFLFVTKIETDNAGLLKLFGLILFLPFAIYGIFKHLLISKFNKIVMRQLCKCFDSFKWTNKSKSFNDYLYQNAFVIPKHYDSVEHDDFFSGNYDGVEIKIDEVNYKQKVRTKRTTYYVSIFRGVVVNFSFNKKFSSHTVVKNNTLLHLSPSKELKHTVLEDVVFEKQYDVFTTDEVESRYILTTAFMDRLNTLKKAFKSTEIICSFYKENLIISLKTGKDMFAFGSLFKSILEPKQYFAVFDEFYSILSIVDTLKLNQKIGL